MEWTRGPTIGRGSSADVSLATNTAGHLFAVKSADVCSSSSLRHEQYLLSQLSSAFIVKCLGSDITWENSKGLFNLFLEYVSGGTLSDLIRNSGGSLEESVIQFYTLQLLKGLDYLHHRGIAHCDIKGQNVLIGQEGLKIADFGCAKKWGGGSATAATIAGTPAYMAPEAARGEDQGFPADIWALGCTIIEMATGSNPWPEMKDPSAALYRVAFSGDVPEFPDWFSDAGKDFLGKCLNRDAGERWTVAELLQHPFMNHCGEIGDGCIRKSPTSVMDHGFWDAMEESDSSVSSPEMGSSLVSPADRVRALIGDSFGSNSNFWGLAEERDWVMVRSNETEEFSKDNNEDTVAFSSIDEQEIQTSAAIEDSFLNSFRDDEIRIVDVSNYHFVLGEISEDDFVILHRMVMEYISHSDQLFHDRYFSSVFLSSHYSS